MSRRPHRGGRAPRQPPAAPESASHRCPHAAVPVPAVVRPGVPAVTPPASRGPGVAPACAVAVAATHRCIEAIWLSFPANGGPCAHHGSPASRLGRGTGRTIHVNGMLRTASSTAGSGASSSDHGVAEQSVEADKVPLVCGAWRHFVPPCDGFGGPLQLNAVFCERAKGDDLRPASAARLNGRVPTEGTDYGGFPTKRTAASLRH